MTGVREMRWSHALYGCCRYNVIKMQRGREVDYEKMKRFKKAAVMLMAAVMCFGMAGCKKTTGGETPTGDVYAPSFRRYHLM